MTRVLLRPNLEEQLKDIAARHQTNLEALVNDWLEEQLWQEQRRKIEQEAERFRAQHAQLYAKYRGRFIAMRDGVVIDDDAEILLLHQRIRARYGDEPILITPVTEEAVQTFRVLGARRQRCHSKALAFPLENEGK
ncbi:MAG: hypothetical protein WCF84_20720 [Anaerolineae bacterium]